jgi:hypothetical protein
MDHRLNNALIHHTTYGCYLTKYGTLALCTGVTGINSCSMSTKTYISECRDLVAYLVCAS